MKVNSLDSTQPARGAEARPSAAQSARGEIRRYGVRRLAHAGVIAGLYAGLTIALPIPQYAGIQCRVSEALTVLPWLLPEAVPGLTVGCFLANLLSPYGLDCVFGTLATLLAALWTRRMRRAALAPLPPVVCNMVIVGAELAWYAAGEGENFFRAWLFNGFTVGLGEAVACYALGTLLLRVLPRAVPALRRREVPAAE